MKKFLLPLVAAICIATPAQADWHKATTDHFEVYADGDSAWVSKFATDLERFDSAVRRLRSFPEDKAPGSNRVAIYLCPPALFSEIASPNIGGFYRGSAMGSTIFMPRDDSRGNRSETLYHEYSHHLLSVAWANLAVPGWLSEGMAQVQSTPETKSDGSVVFGREPRYSEYMLSDLTDQQLSGMITRSTAPTGEKVYYSGGWLVSHFLTFSPKRQGELAQYLVGVNQGKTTAQAATEAFGDVRSLTRDIAGYRRGTSLPGVVIPASEIKVGKVSVRALNPAEAATIEIAMRSRAGVDAETAGPLYARAKAAAAPYANDPAAQRMLAETAYDADDFTTSLAAAERALASDPAYPGAAAYRAMAMSELGRSSADQRAAIEAGLDARPGDAGLLQLYFRTFNGEPLTPLAKSRLIEAYKAAPQDDSLRVTLGQLLLADNQVKEARAVLRPIAFSPHQTGLTKRALAAVEAIERGDTGAARGALSGSITAVVEVPVDAGD